jgi:hypothetical protein
MSQSVAPTAQADAAERLEDAMTSRCGMWW